ncbi:MAG: M1 family aminopeptidase [Polyangiales bacterium]
MRARACGLMLTACLAACAGAPRAHERAALPVPCEGESTVDVRHHDVALMLTLDPPALSGEGTVHVVARTAGDVVMLDARRLDVRSVHDGERPLVFRQQGDHLCIRTTKPLAQGEARTLRLAWAAATNGNVPRFHADAVWAGYRTSAWMPTRDDAAQRTTLRLRVRAPRDLSVIASGREIAVPVTSGAHIERTYAVARPAPPFLFAFAVGRFAEDVRVVDGITVRALGPRGASLAQAQARTTAVLGVLRARLGLSFPGDTYTQVFVPGDAAQEAAGLALLTAQALDDLRVDPDDDWLITHELAHQWFALQVACADFGDFWLNEGFATFLVGVVKEALHGRDAYEAERARWRARSDAVHAEGRDAPLALASSSRPPREDALPPRGVTYMRGALVLDRLRETLGDEAFWRGVRTYVGTQAGKPTRSDDLRRALEHASGHDLAAFFATWVYAPVWAF